MGYINLKDPKPTLLLTDWVSGYLDSLPSLWVLGFFILGYLDSFQIMSQCFQYSVKDLVFTVISLTWSGLLGSAGGEGSYLLRKFEVTLYDGSTVLCSYRPRTCV